MLMGIAQKLLVRHFEQSLERFPFMWILMVPQLLVQSRCDGDVVVGMELTRFIGIELTRFIGIRLPTRVNLSRRGVLLDSHLCPLCNAAMEDVQHVFFRCDVARVVLRKICRWWDLDWQEICSFSDWDAWFLSFRLSSRLKSILEGVFYVAWWRIWRLRNQLVFDASPPNRSTIFDDIACLLSSRAFIIVNGSPTKEFSMGRGLRQGDPLSTFLFIIAKEGLHVAMEDAIAHGLFRGSQIGYNQLHVSHLFYADDALFLGEWDAENIKNLIAILNCYFLVSWLRINLAKSNLYGIEVVQHEVDQMAGLTGCDAGSVP
ncbi:RNA-directed DNA polymerase, eukaryota [Tanacetum coccineum]|uniref:RNA-directed DNA polymerase, eukaryota n=1 Tax=Tanacetum coccineum TaxID=301880 RepID=A0ABQ5EP07_9ASTR